MRIGSWWIRKAKKLVARPGAESIVRRDWLNYLQYSIEPRTKGKLNNSINIVNIEVVKPNQKWKQEMQVQFPNLIERGRIKPQDSCQNPLQESVKKEITRLLREGHIVKVGEIKEDVFLQPTVITVKKERSVKIALEAREPNKNVLKDKYPMPNLDNLMDLIAEKVGKEPGETFFSTLDITYAYEQVELSAETS